MPVTLPIALPALSFSQNPLWLKVLSDDYRQASPVFSVNSITFSGVITADVQLNISWSNGGVILTAKASPDLSGFQFPSGDGSNTYVTNLLPYFQGNYIIDRDFTIAVDTSGANPVLIFTAKTAGAEYDFVPVTGTNYLYSVVTPGNSGSIKPNFNHHIEVWVQDISGNYIIAYNANVPLDEPLTGYTTIDISDCLHSALTLEQPTLDGSYWQPCLATNRKYFIKYAQFYGDTPSVQKVYQSAKYNILYGGYSNLALQQMSDPAGYLGKYLLPDPSLYNFQRWLETWPVDSFTVKTNQPQFLAFVNNHSISETFKIKLDLTFNDATTSTVYLTGGTLAQLAKVLIGLGYQQLGLQSYTTTTQFVTSYVVTLVESTTLTARSLSKTFTIDRNYEEYTRHFVYSDSAGNFKTLHTRGRSRVEANMTFDQVIMQPDSASVIKNGSYHNSNIQAVLSDTVNTGYIVGRGDYDAIMELLYAKMVYRAFGNKLAPVVILSKKFNPSADGESLHAFALEYQLAYQEDLYTADSYALSIPNLNLTQQAINDL